MLLGSHWRGEAGTGDNMRIYWQSGRWYANCRDGRRIELTRIAMGGKVLDEQRFAALFGDELQVGR